jgi:hypothetical protein
MFVYVKYLQDKCSPEMLNKGKHPEPDPYGPVI